MAVCSQEISGDCEKANKKTKKKRKLDENVGCGSENGAECVKKPKKKSKKKDRIETSTQSKSPQNEGDLPIPQRNSDKIPKRKKKRAIETNATPSVNKNNESPKLEHPVKRKKKKRKNAEESEVIPTAVECVDVNGFNVQSTKPVKKKKKKQKPLGEDDLKLRRHSEGYLSPLKMNAPLCDEESMEDSQKPTDLIPMDTDKSSVPSKQRKSKKKSERPIGNAGDSKSVLGAESTTVENNSDANKKPKKRKKTRQLESEAETTKHSEPVCEVKGSMDAISRGTESLRDIVPSKKKKKSKKSSEQHEDSTAHHKSVSLCTSDTSEARAPNTLQSKRKRKADNPEDLISGQGTKKKQKKGNASNNSPSDTQNEDVVSGDQELPRKKKKRKRPNTSDEPNLEESEGGTAQSSKDNLGQWSTARLESTAQQDKFVRLLGGAKTLANDDSSIPNARGQSILSKLSGVWKPPPGRKLFGSLMNKEKRRFASMALDESQSQKLAANLETHYNKTLEFNLKKRKEGNAAKGLGFQEDPAKGKTNYIDIHKVNSIALD